MRSTNYPTTCYNIATDPEGASLPRLKFITDDKLHRALELIVEELGLNHIRLDKVYIVWSKGSKTTALARIWGLPSPFVRLGICDPTYVIELVSEKFARLSCNDIVETIVHELLHIPRSFSGGLRQHGDWSKKRNMRKLLSRISNETKYEVCRLVRESLRSPNLG